MTEFKTFCFLFENAFRYCMRNKIAYYALNKRHIIDKEELMDVCWETKNWKKANKDSTKVYSMKFDMLQYIYRVLYGKQWQSNREFFSQMEDDYDREKVEPFNTVDEVDAFMKFINVIDNIRDKEILIMRFVKGMSWSEIADVIHTSKSMPHMRFAKYMKDKLKEVA